jgi:RND family efflux transporter MFP subunit
VRSKKKQSNYRKQNTRLVLEELVPRQLFSGGIEALVISIVTSKIPMHYSFTIALLLLPAGLVVASENPYPATGAELMCVILPDEQVEVSSPVRGIIAEVLVRRSDRVVRGEVLARLESSVEEATVALTYARAATNAERQLRKVELSYDIQRRDRLQSLHANNSVSSQLREDGERVADTTRIRLRLAEDQGHEAMLEKLRADAVLSLKTIRSPIDGVVVEQYKTVGEYVEDKPILRVVRLNPLRVELIAPLSLFGVVQPGMQVAVRPETDPEHARIATVTTVDPVVDPGSATFGIHLELPNPNLELPAGIKCSGRLLPQVARNSDTPTPEILENPDKTPESSQETAPKSEVLEPVAEDMPGSAVDQTLAVSSQVIEKIVIEAPAYSCISVTGLENESHARELASVAKQLGVEVEISEVVDKEISGYVVLAVAGIESEERQALLARLELAEVKDFVRIYRGSNSGRVSLGVYNRIGDANRRQTAMSALDFNTELYTRHRSQNVWRIDSHLPGSLEVEAVITALALEGRGAPVESTACAGLQTAARNELETGALQSHNTEENSQ